MSDRCTMPVPAELKDREARYVGKRVVLTGDHPHAGDHPNADRAGIVDNLQLTNLGWAFEVKFSNGLSSFVYKEEHMRVLLD